MALQRDARYPGRWTAASAGHPQGAFKNRTAPGSLDGSYIEQDWANDWDGFFGSLLTSSAITANGTVDAVGSSQYFDALKSVVGVTATGRVLRTLVYTLVGGVQQVSINGGAFTATGAGTVSSIAGTNRIGYRILAGGGSGGGAQGTAAGQQSVAGGGGAGGYCEGLFVGSLSSALVVVGAGGPTATAGLTVGNNGTSSSVAGLASATGGAGGAAGVATSTFPLIAGGGNGGISTGANLINTRGNPGTIGLNGSLLNVASGNGGSSPFAGGGQAVGTTQNGAVAGGYGAGGSGGVCLTGTAGGRSGGAGGGGYVELKEYA